MQDGSATALEIIARESQKLGLRFLVIGGHAVMAHGFIRTTADLDLMIRAAERESWRNLMTSLGWQVYGNGPTFLQFNPAESGEPVDFIMVNDQTYESLSKESVEIQPGNPEYRVVSLLHLIALKCHAIKHGHAGRVEKDVDDVIELVKVNHLNVHDDRFRERILKYGIPELYEKLKSTCG
jgi:predicted nucleotidyltransferase